MPTLRVNGVTLYYEVKGSGFPLVFLHPDTLDMTVWDMQVQHFLKRYKTINYDVRGHGRSSAPKSNYSKDDHINDLEILLRNLAVPRCHLVGLSGGGGRAIAFALKHPGMVESLTLVDSTIYGYRIKSSSLFRVAEIARAEGLRAAKEVWLKEGSVSRVSPEVREEVRRIVAGYSGAPLLDPLFGMYRFPSDVERLSEIISPTLVIIGENDLEDFHDMANLLSKKIKNSKKVVVENAGHAPNVDRPDFFNKLVLDFLAEVDNLSRMRLF